MMAEFGFSPSLAFAKFRRSLSTVTVIARIARRSPKERERERESARERARERTRGTSGCFVKGAQEDQQGERAPVLL